MAEGARVHAPVEESAVAEPAFPAGGVEAAQHAVADADATVEEVVVTAQKRAENIQDVPLSIMAVSSKAMEAKGVQDVGDLEKAVPNLRLDAIAQASGVAIRIRGFGAQSNAAIDPSVAPYIDGVFMPRPGAILSTFLDVETVEALEELLISADIGVAATDRIIAAITAKSRDSTTGLRDLVKQEIRDVFAAVDHPVTVAQPPRVTLVVGVNGTGKTTTVGKLANLLKNEGRRPLICAADTFRAAAVEQLEIWATRAGVDFIRARAGADRAELDVVEQFERFRHVRAAFLAHEVSEAL